jgi:hypothetical protein
MVCGTCPAVELYLMCINTELYHQCCSTDSVSYTDTLVWQLTDGECKRLEQSLQLRLSAVYKHPPFPFYGDRCTHIQNIPYFQVHLHVRLSVCLSCIFKVHMHACMSGCLSRIFKVHLHACMSGCLSRIFKAHVCLAVCPVYSNIISRIKITHVRPCFIRPHNLYIAFVHTFSYTYMQVQKLITDFHTHDVQCVDKEELKAFWEGRDMDVRKFQTGGIISANVRQCMSVGNHVCCMH